MISLSLLVVRGSGETAVAFSGDGATNIGAFHEALNLAAVWTGMMTLISGGPGTRGHRSARFWLRRGGGLRPG